MISKYADISKIEKLNQISYDSPTTFIFDNPKDISDFVLGNNRSIAFRVPKNSFCIRLIETFGKPIVSTSANLSGFKVPLNFNDIKPEIKKNVGYVVKLEQAKECNASSRILKYNYDNDCFDRLR
jgi:L-threonylcarbamoyladenylate synthase